MPTSVSDQEHRIHTAVVVGLTTTRLETLGVTPFSSFLLRMFGAGVTPLFSLPLSLTGHPIPSDTRPHSTGGVRAKVSVIATTCS
jgi:hypothetical protein